MPHDTVVVTLNGQQVSLSNLAKVLYPQTQTTKGEVIRYYAEIAPVLLPHLRQHPVTLKRYPNGVEGMHFFEKQCPAHRPPWVATGPVTTTHRVIDFCLVDDTATLVWLANLAALELHPLLARMDALDCPTALVFDLDPGHPATVLDCCRVALELRNLFAELGLRALVKTSGGKGLHCYLPLNTPTTFTETKAFARAVAESFAQRAPERATSIMTKALRTGKVFIDWSQNDDSKTTVSVYSLRAQPTPTVSTPVSWDEIETAWQRQDAAALTFNYTDVLERVATHGDLFAEALMIQQSLPIERLRRIA